MKEIEQKSCREIVSIELLIFEEDLLIFSFSVSLFGASETERKREFERKKKEKEIIENLRVYARKKKKKKKGVEWLILTIREVVTSGVIPPVGK